jgi:glycerol dehydrogenase
MLSVFCSPSRYTQGKNATAVLGAEMAGLGLSGPALIVGGRSPIRLLSDTWSGLSTKSALALAKLCYRTLLADGADALRAVRAQVVTPALERLVEANTLLSGIGFESSGLAAAHAIHNGLTTAKVTRAYLHGEKVAFGLLTQLLLEGQPRSVLDRVLAFATEAGLPITLAAIGLNELTKEQLQTISVRATAEGETIHNEPFEVLPDMVSDAIMAADATGRAWKPA